MSFLFKYGKQFADAIKGTNLFYAGVVAQSIGETGYGRSNLAMNANNFAGVKYLASLHPDFYQTQTKEVVKGKTVTITANTIANITTDIIVMRLHQEIGGRN
jgi:flagellum-specific peptidoglycan hydrolase FlgJ